MLKLMLVLMLLANGTDWIIFPTSQYFILDEGTVHFVKYGTPNIKSPTEWTVPIQFTSMRHHAFITTMFPKMWLTDVTLRDFNEFSKNYVPDTIVDVTPVDVTPVETAVMFRRSLNSLTYHFDDCRYVNMLMVPVAAEDVEKYAPCKVCRPDLIENIVNFLLKTNNE